MKIEATPELEASERRALLFALERAYRHGNVPERRRSAWRLAGLREAVGDEDAEVRYAFSPRSTRGATRA